MGISAKTPQNMPTRPEWAVPCLQFWSNGICAGDGQDVVGWCIDRQSELGGLIGNAREGRHDDPAFREWYQEIKIAACAVHEHLENLSKVCGKYAELRDP